VCIAGDAGAADACAGVVDVLPMLVLASVSVEENVASAILHLLQRALHCSLHGHSSSSVAAPRKTKADGKTHDKPGVL